jgi:hypothetical protein
VQLIFITACVRTVKFFVLSVTPRISQYWLTQQKYGFISVRSVSQLNGNESLILHYIQAQSKSHVELQFFALSNPPHFLYKSLNYYNTTTTRLVTIDIIDCFRCFCFGQCQCYQQCEQHLLLVLITNWWPAAKNMVTNKTSTTAVHYNIIKYIEVLILYLLQPLM